MKTILPIAVLVAGLTGFVETAKAHSFNVALVIALAEPSAGDARQVRDGFLLATRERDGHPDEESDGHLGGLDVYLYPVNLERESLAGVRALLRREQIDILAVIGPDEAAEEIRPLVAGSKTQLLGPGRLQSASTESFTNAFLAAFGYRPATPAAEGYNAGRRIDAAVRPLGGVDDRPSLRRALDETRNGLDW
ncbi:MAG: hypothetical protein KAJ11_10195 [Alphaproteobacteria bacterium]|nr:hypothetical protein [Alphaproteobacteria bacterium]MCK5622648.1 hypothetical protein [Alphaproteobacteria bacterium]